jgi:hypothetical protein|tara:strand:+ start:1550 stop:1723 length:174 start_codon:yes stop_codon:yes gene_type:complete
MKHFQEITVLISVDDYGTERSCGLDAVVGALEGMTADGVSLIDYSNPKNKLLVDEIE